MVFEAYTLVRYVSFRTCDLSISDGVAIMGLVAFIAASLATLSPHQRKWLEPVTQSGHAGECSNNCGCSEVLMFLG
jgi:hypothetical protein